MAEHQTNPYKRSRLNDHSIKFPQFEFFFVSKLTRVVFNSIDILHLTYNAPARKV